MNRPAYLLTLLIAGIFPLSGYTQPPPVYWADALSLSHSTAEAVELLVVLRPTPPFPEEDTIVSVKLTLLDAPNPFVSNVAAGKITLPGLMKIRIRHSATQYDGTACLLVSISQQETEWCGLPMDSGRLAYAVSGSATASFPWGGDIPIAVVDSPTVTIFDQLSGRTVTTFLVNGVKLQGVITWFD